ncbi:MAG: GerAB/ArcD/ProY family transporter [Bacillota bacterium]|nr:GerAB/ArcD/ProY family transporter [Bacillota bacterium]
MDKRLTSSQLFVLMTLLPYGSAALFFIAPEAKQDAWITILIYSLAGIGMQLMYIFLYTRYPQDTVVTYMPKIYGKYLGTMISIIYVSYFLYIATRVYRDFLELISVFTFQHTPRLFFGLPLILVIIYAVYTGIENISYMAQMGFIILIVIVIITFTLIVSTKNAFRPINLFPILNQDIVSLLKGSWRLAFFPYGETVACTMIYPMVIDNNKVLKASVLSIVTLSLLLAFNAVIFISTLGTTFAVVSNFPLLESYRMINISDFLTRMDIIYILALLMSGFFKISILLYVSVLGASQVFRIKKRGILCIVMGAVVYFGSMEIAFNYPQHIKIGLEVALKYFHFPVQVIIPAITIIFYVIKNMILKKPI